MFTKHMKSKASPKNTQLVNNMGKGSQQAGMPDRSSISGMASAPGQSINDYSKATPAGQPTPNAVPGIGTGDWSGNGI